MTRIRTCRLPAAFDPGIGLMKTIIGIDFDNTLVSYDTLMHEVALDQGWISADTPKSKRHIRDSIRRLPDGDIQWQKVQGIVYGPRMQEANLIDGVTRFMLTCRQRRIETYIVSHKTQFANYDDSRTPLRQAALQWMDAHRFFARDGLGLSESHVQFESTRAAKVARIKQLGCTVFIDDLEETFNEPDFPSGVEKILFSPGSSGFQAVHVHVKQSWQEIFDHVFAHTY